MYFPSRTFSCPSSVQRFLVPNRPIIAYKAQGLCSTPLQLVKASSGVGIWQFSLSDVTVSNLVGSPPHKGSENCSAESCRKSLRCKNETHKLDRPCPSVSLRLLINPWVLQDDTSNLSLVAYFKLKSRNWLLVGSELDVTHSQGEVGTASLSKEWHCARWADDATKETRQYRNSPSLKCTKCVEFWVSMNSISVVVSWIPVHFTTLGI